MNDYCFKTDPFDHQLERFAKYRDREYHGHLWEQGTGKSKIIVDNAAYLYNRGKIDCLFIVAPNGVHNSWIKDQVKDHMPLYTNFRAAWYASGPTAKEKECLDKALRHNDGLMVISINVEALSSEKGVKFARDLLNCKKCMLVVDESTTIKNPIAKRTKNILKLGKHAYYRRILTGTPVTQGPLDVFSQFTFLDEHCLGTTSWYAFRNRYTILKETRVSGRSFMQVVGYSNLDELQTIIDKVSDRVLKSECLDLPEKLYQKRYVELSHNQSAMYKAMKKDMIVQFGGAKMSVTMALTKLLRLQQIVGGFFTCDQDYWEGELEQCKEGEAVYPNPKALVTVIDEVNPRVESLIELLKETQGKVIIWARFRGEISIIARRIQEEFGKASLVEYHGGIKTEQRSKAIETFQIDPEVRYFLGNVQAGGKGITLTAAQTMVYYSNDFSLENRLQSEDRAHRIGQTNHVTYIDMIALGTIDERVVKILRDKKNVADMVTGDFDINNW
jgi:SNF2 family DNA or RNA helicase